LARRRRSRERADFWWWLLTWRRRSWPDVRHAVVTYASTADVRILGTQRDPRCFISIVNSRTH
jgi:hypothetical protein